MQIRESAFIFLLLFTINLAGCYVAPVQPTPAPPPRAAWVPIKLIATGAGAPPARAVNKAQARLMAERAAKVDAMRNLLEEAYGVTITSTTTVRDFITQNDTIRARVDAFIRGAKIIDTRYLQDGSVETDMEVTLGYEFRRIFP
jgi:hypothetical protein